MKRRILLSFSIMFALVSVAIGATQMSDKNVVQNFDPTFIAKEELIYQLYNIGSIQFGSFTLPNGATSPVFIDTKRIVSYPDLLPSVAVLVWQEMQGLKFNSICGVPYGALPIAMSVGLLHRQPMIIAHKECYDQECAEPISGVYKKGDTILLIEDIIASGESVQQTTGVLRKQGLQVHDAVVFIDREQQEVVQESIGGIHVHAVFTLSYIIDVLYSGGKIDGATASRVKAYIAHNKRS